MSKYETVYPNTVKYEPQIKKITIEIFGKEYTVKSGVRNLMRISKEAENIDENPEKMFEVLDMMFYKGFCDEIEEIEPNFPFEDFVNVVMDKIGESAPDALKNNEQEEDKDAEPKKE